MDLIIDGYNLLALDKRLDRGLEQSRNSLINKLIRYRQAKPMNLTVVFDGWRCRFRQRNPSRPRWNRDCLFALG